MKINLRAMMLASGLMISMIPFMPGEANADSASSQDKRGLLDITYMQEMAPNICKNSKENDTKQLIDKRDGKTYWVAKLKDGNCWMTQNLDLDIPAEGLSEKDTDILADWNSSSTYKPVATQTGSPAGFNTNNEIASYDPGEFVYTTPIARNSCGTTTKLEGCKNWTKVAGLSTSSSNDEQAHYLAGNYYSWAAATAGQAASLTSDTPGEQSTQSICPKGWTLPTGGSSSQYKTLVNGLVASTTDTANNLKLAPYYFVYGGYVNSGSLYNAGSEGRYWSSTAYNATQAYNLDFGTGVNTSTYNSRYLGYSVRCVARTDSSIPDNNDNVTINVTPTLSLDVAATTEIPYTAGDVSTGSLSATVKSNQQYTIQLSAAKPDLVNEADSNKIIPADANVSAGTSAWGIKKKESATGTVGSTTDLSAYTALTATPSIFYRSAAGSDGAASVNFAVGISTNPSIASGTYSTNVTVTATTI